VKSGALAPLLLFAVKIFVKKRRFIAEKSTFFAGKPDKKVD